MPEKKRGANPKKIYTQEQRNQVLLLSGLGLKQDEIAIVTNIPEIALKRHFREELTKGLVVADAKVMNNLFRIATSDKPQAAPTAMFWAKVRRKWHEVQRVIHGFDPSTAREMVALICAAVRRLVPESCPHCKTRLDLHKPIAEELRAISARMEERLPPDEIVPRPAPAETGIEP